MLDRYGGSRFHQVGPRDLPHLLEWHSSHCICLADTCDHPRVKHLLRLLAADLAIEAGTQRRRLQQYDETQLKPTFDRSRDLPMDLNDRRAAPWLRLAAQRA